MIFSIPRRLLLVTTPVLALALIGLLFPPLLASLFDSIFIVVDILVLLLIAVFGPRNHNVYGFLLTFALWRTLCVLMVPGLYEAGLMTFLFGCIVLNTLAIYAIKYRFTLTYWAVRLTKPAVRLSGECNKALQAYRLLPQEWALLWLLRIDIVYNTIVISETALEKMNLISADPFYQALDTFGFINFVLGLLVTASFVFDRKHRENLFKA